MDLTEFEFEDLLSLAMKDNGEVPLKTNEKLKKKLDAKLRYKRIIKVVPSSLAACLVVGVVLVSVVHNNQELYDFKVDDTNQFQNQGVVIKDSQEKNVISEENFKTKDVPTQQKTDNKSEKQAEIKDLSVTEKVSSETYKQDVKPEDKIVNENIPAETAQIEVYSVAKTQVTTDETSVEETQVATDEASVEEASVFLAKAMPTASEMLLADYLENNQELIDDVSEKIKEKMSDDEYVDFYEDFTSVTGNENYYLTEKNELVVIFKSGVVAAEENGEIYINVGVIKHTDDESGELK